MMAGIEPTCIVLQHTSYHSKWAGDNLYWIHVCVFVSAYCVVYISVSRCLSLTVSKCNTILSCYIFWLFEGDMTYSLHQVYFIGPIACFISRSVNCIQLNIYIACIDHIVYILCISLSFLWKDSFLASLWHFDDAIHIKTFSCTHLFPGNLILSSNPWSLW